MNHLFVFSLLMAITHGVNSEVLAADADNQFVLELALPVAGVHGAGTTADTYVTGGGVFDYFASGSRGVGDINHDGIDDFVVAESGADTADGGDFGACYVIFGTAAGFTEGFDVNALNGSNGFKIVGNHEDHFVCDHIRKLGDFNGDGIDDLLIGADEELDGTHVNYIFLGQDQSTFTHPFNISNINGTNGAVIKFSSEVGSYFPVALPAGDVNHDGMSDLMVGHNGDQGADFYVMYGRSQLTTVLHVVDQANGVDGFLIPDVMGDLLFLGTWNYGHAGDLNNDGIDDFFLYGGRANDTDNLYVIFGDDQGFPAIFDHTTVDGNNGFIATGNFMGGTFQNAFKSAGDFNQDGGQDLLIASSRQSKLFLLYSRSTPYPAVFDVDDGAAEGVLEIITNEDPYDLIFNAFNAVGDINDDGVDDVVIDYRVRGIQGTTTGHPGIFTLLGQVGNKAGPIDLSRLSLPDGFKLTKYIYSNFYQITVNPAGDVNADGIDDLIVGNANGLGSRGYGRIIYGQTDLQDYIFTTRFE